MLQWTLGCIYHFELEFSPDICSGVRLLYHMETLFLVFSFFFNEVVTIINHYTDKVNEIIEYEVTCQRLHIF